MFCTNERWEQRHWNVERLDLHEGAADALLNAWGVPLRRRLLRSVQSHQPIAKGHRFDLGGGLLLEWTVEESNGLAAFEERAGELSHLPQAQLSRMIIDAPVAPMGPVVEFKHELLAPPGTRFIFQPRELLGGGAAAAIVGSYAVRDATGAKLVHIPRPCAVDRDGRNRVWGEIEIAGGEETVRFRTADLVPLARPISVYGLATFGYYNGGTPGGTSSNHGDDFVLYAGPFACGGSGTATKVTVYVKRRTGAGAADITHGFYNESGGAPNARQADGDENATFDTTPAWVDNNLDTGTAVTAQNYWIATCCDANPSLYYDAGSAKLRDQSYTYVDGVLPATANSGNEITGRDYSYYVTYTPTGGEAGAPVLATMGIHSTVCGGMIVR